MVEPTHLKNTSQIGSFPQLGVNIKNVWNHQPEQVTWISSSWSPSCRVMVQDLLQKGLCLQRLEPTKSNPSKLEQANTHHIPQQKKAITSSNLATKNPCQKIPLQNTTRAQPILQLQTPTTNNHRLSWDPKLPPPRPPPPRPYKALFLGGVALGGVP